MDNREATPVKAAALHYALQWARVPYPSGGEFHLADGPLDAAKGGRLPLDQCQKMWPST